MCLAEISAHNYNKKERKVNYKSGEKMDINASINKIEESADKLLDLHRELKKYLTKEVAQDYTNMLVSLYEVAAKLKNLPKTFPEG